jgi:Ca-activated chloride channel family protein
VPTTARPEPQPAPERDSIAETAATSPAEEAKAGATGRSPATSVASLADAKADEPAPGDSIARRPAKKTVMPASPTGSFEGREAGYNPPTVTAEDSLSTFAIDVDTASYSLMRRDVNGGVLPVPEGVRVEEYVNYFRYGDAPPAAEDDFPFSIHLDARPSPFGAGLELLRVNLTGRDVDREALKPANLIFLVDVSGSMQSPDKIGLVQYTLTELTGQLRPSDTIGIVTYAGEVRVALPPTPVEDRNDILAAIDGLTAGGSTYGEGGIRLAYDTAAQAFRQGGINRVILCTDGDFNVGLTGDALIELIEEERDRGITLSAIGFGTGNYNDATMEQLADRGNGNYGYVDSDATRPSACSGAICRR